MRRIPIQLDEETYRALKKRAFEEERSIASIVRESLASHATAPVRSIGDFAFVASGKQAGNRRERVSERHDAALAEIFSNRRKRK